MSETAPTSADSAPPRSHLDPCGRGLAAAEPCPEEAGRALPPARRRLILAACILASSMAFIDGSALTVALPNLRDDLGADLQTVQWIVNAYMLALAAFVLIGGAAADVYGKGRMLTIGCVAFGAASAACALAGDAGLLIAARAAQGLAAAVVAPASLALIGATYPKAERGKAIGVWASASALTTAGGPVLGGWLTEAFGWPAIFWLNPPFAIVAVALLIAGRADDAPQPRAFDVPGAALLAAALGLVAWGLSALAPAEGAGEAATATFSMTTIAALGAGLALIAGYVAWERRSDHPMTPPRLFANAAFSGLNAATLFIYAGLSIVFFLLPFELIDRRGFSATAAGAAFLPFTLAVGLLSTPAGALADRFGARTMLTAGGALAALGYALMAALGALPFAASILFPLTIIGLAFAAMVGPLTAAVMSSVPDRDEGLASGVSNAASRIAQLIGVALAAGLASLAGGYVVALAAAALASALGAVLMARSAPEVGSA